MSTTTTETTLTAEQVAHRLADEATLDDNGRQQWDGRATDAADLLGIGDPRDVVDVLEAAGVDVTRRRAGGVRTLRIVTEPAPGLVERVRADEAHEFATAGPPSWSPARRTDEFVAAYRRHRAAGSPDDEAAALALHYVDHGREHPCVASRAEHAALDAAVTGALHEVNREAAAAARAMLAAADAGDGPGYVEASRRRASAMAVLALSPWHQPVALTDERPGFYRIAMTRTVLDGPAPLQGEARERAACAAWTWLRRNPAGDRGDGLRGWALLWKRPAGRDDHGGGAAGGFVKRGASGIAHAAARFDDEGVALERVERIEQQWA